MRIITDSAADFTPAELERLGVTCVPMQIVFGADSYIDGRTLPPELFWRRLTAGENPKTSQPSPDAFLSVFEEAKAAGEEIVCVLLSSALSGTLQSALIARDMIGYEPIYIVDSLMAAVAQKLLVLHACRLRDEGALSAARIAEQLEALRPRIRLYACLDTLEYLARGGRIPKAAASLGSMVRFKPLVTLTDDGRVELAGKGIGLHRATEALIRLVEAHEIDRSFPVLPIYSHTPEHCLAFVHKLHDVGIACDETAMLPIGATIATHIGPGAFGIVFVSRGEGTKER